MIGADQLHLPDLGIEGFRGIDRLSIPRLGRVTLFAGKNAIGKTTVLDAVRVYVARSNYQVLREMLIGREEFSTATDEDGNTWPEPNWQALFHGRSVNTGGRIRVWSGDDELLIEEHRSNLKEAARIIQLYSDFNLDDDIRVLRVTFRGRQWMLPCLVTPDEEGSNVRLDNNRLRRLRVLSNDLLPPAFNWVSLGPGILTNREMARFWDDIALTDDEDRAARGLGMVLGKVVERVAVIGENTSGGNGRRVAIKLQGSHQPVPLKSLGDGATRLFGVALALANSTNGFLLIDEAENGIHYSVQKDYWRMVLQTALENNVQVLATTHSWDCVTGFAAAAEENDDVEGVLFRLDRVGKKLRAVEYSEDDLAVAAEQGIEVR